MGEILRRRASSISGPKYVVQVRYEIRRHFGVLFLNLWLCFLISSPLSLSPRQNKTVSADGLRAVSHQSTFPVSCSDTGHNKMGLHTARRQQRKEEGLTGQWHQVTCLRIYLFIADASLALSPPHVDHCPHFSRTSSDEPYCTFLSSCCSNVMSNVCLQVKCLSDILDVQKFN